jgi:hypothetical protein
MEPTNYFIDGGYSGSGVLDVAREVQLRLKHWAYAYRTTKDTKWVDRAWRELQTAAGNTTQPFGRTGNNWNTEFVLLIHSSSKKKKNPLIVFTFIL